MGFLLKCLGKLLVNSVKSFIVLGIIVLACWSASGAIMEKIEDEGAKRNLTDAVTVNLYYETYCPDCESFILHQLYPVHASLREKLVIDFVPFGKAEQTQIDGETRFDCQHGPLECEGNKLHACAVREACGERQPQDCPGDQRLRLMEFVYCNLKQYDHLGSAKECAINSGLNADEILKCANGSTGTKLLSHYGNRTSAFRPAIGRYEGFVPSIAIDGVPNKNAWRDLRGEICKLRPTLC